MLMDKLALPASQEADLPPLHLGASVMESKMGIDTLLLAARYLEEKEEQDKELERLSPQQPQQQIPMTIVQSTPMLQHVVQPQQPATIPIQHVTIQHALPIQNTNGHHVGNNITLATQQVNTIRINKKDVVSVTPAPVQINHRMPPVMNSFDLINPPVIDQGSGELKRKQPPMAFRTGTREVHNKLEKNRRAHLKECFDELYAVLPNSKDNKKTSNLNILASAIKYIQSQQEEERNNVEKIEKLNKRRIILKEQLNTLKKEIKIEHKVDVSLPEVEDSAALARKFCRDTLIVKSQLEQLTATTITLKSSPEPEGIKQELTNGQQTVLSTTPTVNATPLYVGNVLKLPKSIKSIATTTTTGKSVVASSINGIKENSTTNPTTATNATTTSVSVLPAFSYHQIQQNGTGLVLLPKAIGSGQLTHFMDGNGKVMPTIVNAQYVVKPLVVVSTPSRPS